MILATILVKPCHNLPIRLRYLMVALPEQLFPLITLIHTRFHRLLRRGGYFYALSWKVLEIPTERLYSWKSCTPLPSNLPIRRW